LVFGIYVNDTHDTFLTGDGSRNHDGIAHAVVDDSYFLNGEKATYVGFEDLLNGGGRDFDDLKFAFTNTTTSVPEPSLISLLGLGIIVLCFKKKNR
jgi:hypothetical protein